MTEEERNAITEALKSICELAEDMLDYAEDIQDCASDDGGYDIEGLRLGLDRMQDAVDCAWECVDMIENIEAKSQEKENE